MSQGVEVAANKLIVLGGGFNLDYLGYPELSSCATDRLDRAVRHYRENEARFDSDDARIVCTGWQTPAFIDTVTPAYMHECDEAEDYLVSKGVPRKLIRKEATSTNTMLNVVNTFLEGLVKVEELSPENPVGFVSHTHHLERAALFARRIGIPLEYIQKIPTENPDSRLREFIVRTGWQALLIRTAGPDEMVKRSEAFTELAGHQRITKVRMALSKIHI